MIERAGPSWRHTLVLGICLAVAGCQSASPMRSDPQAPYCMRLGKPYSARRLCTADPVPSAELARTVQQFLPEPGVGQIYVVRKRWSDAVHLVSLGVDGRHVVDMLPNSLVRLRVAPGLHKLSLGWQGVTEEVAVEVDEGGSRFAEIDGRLWLWNSSYRWTLADAAGAKARARTAKLIADLDLRGVQDGPR